MILGGSGRKHDELGLLDSLIERGSLRLKRDDTYSIPCIGMTIVDRSLFSAPSRARLRSGSGIALRLPRQARVFEVEAVSKMGILPDSSIEIVLRS